MGTFETNPTHMRIYCKPHRKKILVIDLATELKTHACTMTIQSKSAPVNQENRGNKDERLAHSKWCPGRSRRQEEEFVNQGLTKDYTASVRNSCQAAMLEKQPTALILTIFNQCKKGQLLPLPTAFKCCYIRQILPAPVHTITLEGPY